MHAFKSTQEQTGQLDTDSEAIFLFLWLPHLINLLKNYLID